jgi:hypothetical protein
MCHKKIKEGSSTAWRVGVAVASCAGRAGGGIAKSENKGAIKYINVYE